jgi:biotin transport system substrate-specific component
MRPTELTVPTRSVVQAMRWVVPAVAGALLVTIGAQIAVPIPGTPVPMTFQVPAVLIVGGLLGPRLGAVSMVLYVAMGASGLPVFAPFGAPGLARLFGPTGGYLLACPLAAAVTGQLAAGGRSWGRTAVAVVAGLVVIYAGGIVQLAALGGNVSAAVRIGSLPFLAGDVIKLLIAGFVVRRLGSLTRALR